MGEGGGSGAAVSTTAHGQSLGEAVTVRRMFHYCRDAMRAHVCRLHQGIVTCGMRAICRVTVAHISGMVASVGSWRDWAEHVCVHLCR